MSSQPPAPAELALLESAVAENPGSRLFLRLARAYLQAGRLGQASQTLTRGLGLQPWEVEAHQLLAEVLQKQGDPDGALAQFCQAAAVLSRHAGLYQGLAGLLMAQGRGQEAMVAQRLARDLQTGFAGPPAPEHQVAAPEAAGQDTPTLAEIYAAQGLTAKAVEIYRRLLALEPDNQRLAQRLAQLEGSGLDAPPSSPGREVLARLEALQGAALARRGGDGAEGGQALLGRLEALQRSALERAGQA
ncbi:MAG: tetratricopeptide repeat protein [Desulfarculus sp.]|nr:tetratricopeptide repeat protein [Desulfarculus sp.]